MKIGGCKEFFPNYVLDTTMTNPILKPVPAKFAGAGAPGVDDLISPDMVRAGLVFFHAYDEETDCPEDVVLAILKAAWAIRLGLIPPGKRTLYSRDDD